MVVGLHKAEDAHKGIWPTKEAINASLTHLKVVESQAKAFDEES